MSIGKSGIIPNNLGFIASDLLYISRILGTYHGPKKGSKYHVETVQTTFNEKNKY